MPTEPAQIIAFPDMSKRQRGKLLGPEIGTQFDAYTRLFASYSGGEVFETGEWRARDLDTMFRRDGDASSLEQALTLPLRSLEYSIEPAKGDTGEAEEAIKQVQTPLEEGGSEIDLDLVIGQMTGARIFRKTFFEKKWDEEDGRVILRKLAWRPPATCDIKRDDETGEFQGFRQKAWWFSSDPKKQKTNTDGYVDIPKNRAFVFIHGQHRSPLTGSSDMDVAYWAYEQKQKIAFLWFQFLEMQSLPKLAVYGTDQPQANEYAEQIATMKSSSVGGFERPPGGAKLFDIIESSGKGADQFIQALTFLTAYQQNSVLLGWLSLSSAASQGRGSFALSQDQSNFYLKANQAVVKEMCKSFRRDVLAPITFYNRGAGAAVPTLKASPLTEGDAAQIVAAFSSLAVAPSLRVPDEYVDLLATRAAEVLDLPGDKVEAAIKEGATKRAEAAKAASQAGATQAAQGAAKIAGATDAASKLLAQGGANGPAPSPNGNATGRPAPTA